MDSHASTEIIHELIHELIHGLIHELIHEIIHEIIQKLAGDNTWGVSHVPWTLVLSPVVVEGVFVVAARGPAPTSSSPSSAARSCCNACSVGISSSGTS